MKRVIILGIVFSIFYTIFNFFLYCISLDYAIIPRYLLPATYISSAIRGSPLFLGIGLLAIGLGLYVYLMYLFMMIIYKRTKSWWKSLYFTFVISFSLGFALLSRPLLELQEFYPPLNLTIVGILIFSTILLFPLKKFRYLIVPYVTYLVTFIILVGIFFHGFSVLKGWMLYLAPFYVILLYFLTFRFLSNRNIIYFLFLILLFAPLRIVWETKYGKLRGGTQKVEYTIIVPSDSYHEVKEFELPFENFLSYIAALELDSAFNSLQSIYGKSYFIPLYFDLNLNEERIVRIDELLRNERIYVGASWRKEIKEKITDRWESKAERGVIIGKLTGDIPDRIGLIKQKDIGFRWVIRYMMINAKDAVSPDNNGYFKFDYVLEGEYELIFLYKRKVPHYKAEIPIISSNNDSIDLGEIIIE